MKRFLAALSIILLSAIAGCANSHASDIQLCGVLITRSSLPLEADEQGISYPQDSETLFSVDLAEYSPNDDARLYSQSPSGKEIVFDDVAGVAAVVGADGTNASTAGIETAMFGSQTAAGLFDTLRVQILLAPDTPLDSYIYINPVFSEGGKTFVTAGLEVPYAYLIEQQDTYGSNAIMSLAADKSKCEIRIAFEECDEETSTGLLIEEYSDTSATHAWRYSPEKLPLIFMPAQNTTDLAVSFLKDNQILSTHNFQQGSESSSIDYCMQRTDGFVIKGSIAIDWPLANTGQN